MEYSETQIEAAQDAYEASLYQGEEGDEDEGPAPTTPEERAAHREYNAVLATMDMQRDPATPCNADLIRSDAYAQYLRAVQQLRTYYKTHDPTELDVRLLTEATSIMDGLLDTVHYEVFNDLRERN